MRGALLLPAARTGRTAAAPSVALLKLWLATSGALLAVYAGQELLEGILTAGQLSVNRANDSGEKGEGLTLPRPHPVVTSLWKGTP